MKHKVERTTTIVRPTCCSSPKTARPATRTRRSIRSSINNNASKCSCSRLWSRHRRPITATIRINSPTRPRRCPSTRTPRRLSATCGRGISCWANVGAVSTRATSSSRTTCWPIFVYFVPIKMAVSRGSTKNQKSY